MGFVWIATCIDHGCKTDQNLGRNGNSLFGAKKIGRTLFRNIDQFIPLDRNLNASPSPWLHS